MHLPPSRGAGEGRAPDNPRLSVLIFVSQRRSRRCPNPATALGGDGGGAGGIGATEPERSPWARQGARGPCARSDADAAQRHARPQRRLDRGQIRAGGTGSTGARSRPRLRRRAAIEPQIRIRRRAPLARPRARAARQDGHAPPHARAAGRARGGGRGFRGHIVRHQRAQHLHLAGLQLGPQLGRQGVESASLGITPVALCPDPSVVIPANAGIPADSAEFDACGPGCPLSWE